MSSFFLYLELFVQNCGPNLIDSNNWLHCIQQTGPLLF